MQRMMETVGDRKRSHISHYQGSNGHERLRVSKMGEVSQISIVDVVKSPWDDVALQLPIYWLGRRAEIYPFPDRSGRLFRQQALVKPSYGIDFTRYYRIVSCFCAAHWISCCHFRYVRSPLNHIGFYCLPLMVLDCNEISVLILVWNPSLVASSQTTAPWNVNHDGQRSVLPVKTMVSGYRVKELYCDVLWISVKSVLFLVQKRTSVTPNLEASHLTTRITE